MNNGIRGRERYQEVAIAVIELHETDCLGMSAHRNGADDRIAAGIDDRSGLIRLIGDHDASTVESDGDAHRSVADRYCGDYGVACSVDDRQRIVGAVGDVDALAAGSDSDVVRNGAHRNGGRDRVRGGVDDRHVVATAVGDVCERGGAGGCGKR